tara:strand:+ start:218 stop:589 length:372 start_codon:yes stop_codon:yes gene_type:complete
MEKAKMKDREEKVKLSLVETVKKNDCEDKRCHVHGNLKIRGRVFEGKVIKKFQKRIVIELERMTYVRKYERYKKSKTRIHARLPICMDNEIKIGDLIKVRECRPLSKIIHFAVIEKIKGEDER